MKNSKFRIEGNTLAIENEEGRLEFVLVELEN